MTWPATTALAAMLAAVSCGRGAKDDGPTCAERTAELSERLLAHADAPIGLVPRNLTPIESTAGAPIEQPAELLVVERSGAAVLDDRPVTIPDGLRAGLAADVEAHPDRRALYLWLDAGSPVATLAQVLAVVPAEREPRIMVVGPTPPPYPRDGARAGKPSVQALIAELRDADPANKAATLARRVEAAVRPCAAVAKVFASVAAPGVDSGQVIADTVPAALRSCGCKVTDLDLLEWALLSIYGVGEPPQRWVPVGALPPGATGTVGALYGH